MNSPAFSMDPGWLPYLLVDHPARLYWGDTA
jgi:hypothetical protein